MGRYFRCYSFLFSIYYNINLINIGILVDAGGYRLVHIYLLKLFI